MASTMELNLRNLAVQFEVPPTNYQTELRLGELSFELARTGSNDGRIRLWEGSSPVLDTFDLGFSIPYSRLTSFSSPIALRPGEEVRFGRTHGVQIFDAEGQLDESRMNTFVDNRLAAALRAYRGISRVRAGVKILKGNRVEVCDLDSTNGTEVRIKPWD